MGAERLPPLDMDRITPLTPQKRAHSTDDNLDLNAISTLNNRYPNNSGYTVAYTFQERFNSGHKSFQGQVVITHGTHKLGHWQDVTWLPSKAKAKASIALLVLASNTTL
jgi:hypothetical protein